MTGATMPHPVSCSMAREQLAAAFIRITHDSLPDPAWHFQLALPRASRIAPTGNRLPVCGGGLMSLVLFRLPEPAADLEIYGELLPAELDPADYLDLWLESNAITAVSRKRLPGLAGAVGDVVGAWTTGEGSFAGRFFCMKAGPRLVLLAFRTAADDYPELAEKFFFTITTFGLLHDPFGPLAEKIQWVSDAAPTPWKLALPIAWTLQPEAPQVRAASFQAALTSTDPAARGVLLGKLSFAMVAPDQVATPAEAFERALAAVRDAGLSPRPAVPTAEPAEAPYQLAAHRVTTLDIQGQPAECRCRVLGHPRAWVIAAVVTPARSVAPPLWMHNKRVLDIVTSTLEIAP